MSSSLALKAAWFTVALSVIAATAALTARAQGTTSLSVSPVTFELTARPSETISNEIKVTNQSDATLQLEAIVENIAGAGELGQVTLSPEETPFALSSWITTTPSQFTLGPKSSRTVKFTVAVPPQAEPGGHYGSILFGTTARDKLDSTGAAIVQRVGSLILVRVAGAAKEEAALVNFAPKTFVGKWEAKTGSDGRTTIYSVVEEDRSKETVKRYFSRGPVAFDLKIANNGNVHVKPVGVVTIHNLLGKKVDELVVDGRNVFPGNSRQFTVVWPNEKLWGVYYKANVAFLYGEANKPLVAATSFWAFPLWAGIAAGVGLAAVALLRRRLWKAINILAKGG